jgi:hypothetical protein
MMNFDAACQLGLGISFVQPEIPCLCLGKIRRLVHAHFSRIRNEGEFEVEVLLLSNIRSPASIVQTLYRRCSAPVELAGIQDRHFR